MIIQSVGQLENVNLGWAAAPVYSRIRMYDSFSYDYETIYRTQPNVRTCVDFLSRNVAHLGLHVFKRVDDTDRQRLRDHGLAQVLSQPMPPEYKVTRYRLIETLLGDLGVYFNAYWLKFRNGAARWLMRVPPQMMTVAGGLYPTQYTMRLAGQDVKFPPDDVVHFRGYNAGNAVMGLSPLETLRRVLAEEHAMGDYREGFWKNAARMSGIITRPPPPAAPEWSKEARERFKAEFEDLYTGGENSGKTAILEEGMDWKAITFNAQESEYLAGRKLTREECARAYHIPLPLVGILDHATFSNIEAQHKHLYQDCLGPWLAMIEQEIELQLLPEFADIDGVYVEFNIREKMEGSFAEQTAALQSAVGRPYMSADEARARMNLPAVGGDAARLVTPLNVLVGGLASPRDTAPKMLTKAEGEIDSTLSRNRVTHEARWRQVLGKYFKRQESAVLSRIPAKHRKQQITDVWADVERWDSELETELFQLNLMTAKTWAEYIAAMTATELDIDEMLPWLQSNARIAAQSINGATRAQVEDVLVEPESRDKIKDIFLALLTVRLGEIVISKVTSASNYGANAGARQSGFKSKMWQVNSGNPRSMHAAMNGEVAGIRDRFSNGMLWPGDPVGGPENNANCHCSVVFGR